MELPAFELSTMLNDHRKFAVSSLPMWIDLPRFGLMNILKSGTFIGDALRRRCG